MAYPRDAMDRNHGLGSARRSGPRTALWVWAALLWAIGTWGCGDESPVTVLRLAHGLDTGHPVHRALGY